MRKKRIFIAGILLIILILSAIALKLNEVLPYDLDGTYSAGNEPDHGNIYMVLKNEAFTIYNQNQVLDSGSVEEINSDKTSDIYKLISKDNTKAGYVVYDKNQIVLLDFQGMDLSLEKTSKHAIYLGYESE